MDGVTRYKLSFQRIVEGLPNALFIADAQGDVVYLNKAATALFGYTNAELAGKSGSLLLPEHMRERYAQVLKQYFDAPESVAPLHSMRIEALSKEGDNLAVEFSASPLVTVNGMMVLVSVQPATMHVGVNELFRLVVESAPNAMVLVDSEGRILMVNKKAVELFGYDKTTLYDKRIEDLVPHRHRGDHAQMRSDFYADPIARPMGAGRDLSAIRSDGTEVPVKIGLNPIQTDDGIMVLASIIEITQQ